MSAINPISRKRDFALPVALLFGLVIACVAISRQSFWIDETETAMKAVQPTLAGWWQLLYAEHNSNLQLPLYMFYIWGWARVFGASEFALRAAKNHRAELAVADGQRLGPFHGGIGVAERQRRNGFRRAAGLKN